MPSLHYLKCLYTPTLHCSNNYTPFITVLTHYTCIKYIYIHGIGLRTSINGIGLHLIQLWIWRSTQYHIISGIPMLILVHRELATSGILDDSLSSLVVRSTSTITPRNRQFYVAWFYPMLKGINLPFWFFPGFLIHHFTPPLTSCSSFELVFGNLQVHILILHLFPLPYSGFSVVDNNIPFLNYHKGEGGFQWLCCVDATSRFNLKPCMGLLFLCFICLQAYNILVFPYNYCSGDCRVPKESSCRLMMFF